MTDTAHAATAADEVAHSAAANEGTTPAVATVIYAVEPTANILARPPRALGLLLDDFKAIAMAMVDIGATQPSRKPSTYLHWVLST